jgi:glycosyltransferase involved in cell wall biosynthesis
MQGEYIEETIRSVLLQGYPDIEYIIVDGGSRDNSSQVIEKYAQWLAWWCSGKDRGQADAINKGLSRVTGGIVAYINSDDWYHPGAFSAVAQRALEQPEEDWWAGGVEVCDGENRTLKTSAFNSLPRFLGRAETLYQPGVFWSARMLRAAPAFDTSLHYAFDHDYWVRALNLGYHPVALGTTLANFRVHGRSKTSTRQRYFMRELWEVARRYRPHLSPSDWKSAAASLRDYEADYLLTSIYSLLAAGERRAAASYLLSSLSLYPHITPARLIAGAYYRTFVAGTPPKWFRKS